MDVLTDCIPLGPGCHEVAGPGGPTAGVLPPAAGTDPGDEVTADSQVHRRDSTVEVDRHAVTTGPELRIHGAEEPVSKVLHHDGVDCALRGTIAYELRHLQDAVPHYHRPTVNPHSASETFQVTTHLFETLCRSSLRSSRRYRPR